MNAPTVNACAVDETASSPNFFELVRAALPQHTHAHITGDRTPHWEATWSTPAAVWKLTPKPLNPDRLEPGGTLEGPGGTLTFPKGTHANQVIELLRGLGALPELGDLTPEANRSGVVRTQADTVLVESLSRLLPEHAHVTQGVAAVGIDMYSPTFVINTTFGSRTELTPPNAEARTRWSAAWTNPHGRFSVELNPVDPSRRGVLITSPWGKWHLPNPDDHFRVVSALRGLGGLPPAAPEPTEVKPDLDALRRAFDRVQMRRDHLTHFAVGGTFGPRTHAEALTRRLRSAMQSNTVEKGRRRDSGRWIDVDVAAAVCAAHVLAEEAKSNG